ncbi:hypothetical protein ACTFIY_011618 [Dictyostelium cf. discoideum]
MSKQIIETITIKNGDDFKRILQNNQELSNEVKDNQKNIISISIPKIMKKLMISGDLTNLSYEASYGFPCNSKIMEIMLDYQTFIKIAKETCSVFVMKSIQGFNYIKEGLNEAHQGDFECSVALIKANSTIADFLANKANYMSMLADDLVKKSRDTLLFAINNRTQEINKENEAIQKKIELEVAKENYNQKLIVTEIADEVGVKEKKRIFKILLLFGDTNKESNYKKESELLKQKTQIQERERRSTSELAGKIKQLELLVGTKNQLNISVGCLDITIKTLGEIKTSFNNATISGINWLSIAQMNIEALDYMKCVDNGVDNIVSNLATGKEVEKRVKEGCKTISQKLENNLIEESQIKKLNSFFLK